MFKIEQCNAIEATEPLISNKHVSQFQNMKQGLACHLVIKHTSSIQNFARHVGQGEVLANHLSGSCWFWRLANHFPIQSIHHIGLQ